MANKVRHAFGNLESVDSALSTGAINNFDVLFLKDANGKPYVGWIDRNGQKVIVEDEKQVVVVESETLPEFGEVGKVYIFNDEGYFWDGTQFKPLTKPEDLSALENQVDTLRLQMISKVDASTVQTMIEEHSESAIEIVEF